MLILTKRKRIVLILATLLAILAGSGWAYYCWRYPFGWSHSCDKILQFGLMQYAEKHGGVYPAGEATPEASLALLCPKYISVEVLRGKIVPVEVVQEALDNGQPLGPDTCGWHYVEGLRSDDDTRLALCWDKAGLGHFGDRLPKGSHWVIFVGTFPEIRYVDGGNWEAFLAEQKTLLDERAKKTAKQKAD